VMKITKIERLRSGCPSRRPAADVVKMLDLSLGFLQSA